MKKIYVFLFIFLLSIFGMGNAKAFTSNVDRIKFGETINYTKNIGGDLYLAGNDITVDSIIEGDIIGAGGNIDVTGRAIHNVRMAGNNLNFYYFTAYNITIAGSKITLNNVIANNIYAAGSKINFIGNANSINFAAQDVIIDGVVNGTSYIEASNVTIKEGTVISGKLKVNSPNAIVYEGNIDKTNITYKKVVVDKAVFIKSKISNLVYRIMYTSLMGFLIIFLFGNFIKNSLKNIKEKKAITLLKGFAALVIIPVLIIAAFISTIGAPIGVIALFMYITAIIINYSFASVILGDLIFKDMNKYLKILIASSIICTLSLIPMISFFVWIISISALFGSIINIIPKRK